MEPRLGLCEDDCRDGGQDRGQELMGSVRRGFLERFDMEPAWGAFAPGKIHYWLIKVNRRLKSRYWNKNIRKVILLFFSVYDIKWNGIKMRCYVRDNATERDVVFSNRNWEELFAITNKLRNGDIFVDIGANCGLFSLVSSRKVGPSGRVISIEPNPKMIERLIFNVRENRADNVEIMKSAIGDFNGEMKLYINTRQMGMSSAINFSKSKPVTVPVKTLLEILGDLDVEKIDALKIDIEGFEDRALIPFFNSASRGLWPKTILLETRHARQDNSNHLEKLTVLGYKVKWQGSNDLLMECPLN
ncbi:MAG: FkbM family methyltransferase [Rhodomicrobiaceae bacterium]